ncbi:ankyrin repeat-containing domain protein [Cladorrhinum sp. PSN332]|nr:ankyrin repeat-containing domain protein [Cladorrhinum sp. PSN332]
MESSGKFRPYQRRNLGTVLSPYVDAAGKLALKNVVVDGQGRTVLHLAAAYGATDLFERHITNLKTGLRTKDKHGQIPLHSAAICGQTAIVELIVKSGGPGLLSAQNDAGKTPLHLALKNAALSAAQELVELGSPLLIGDEDGKLPIFDAVRVAINTGNFSLLSSIWTTTESQRTSCSGISLFNLTTTSGLNLLDYAVWVISEWELQGSDPDLEAEWDSDDSDAEWDPTMSRPDWETGEEPSQTCNRLEVVKFLVAKGFNPGWKSTEDSDTTLEFARWCLSRPVEEVTDEAMYALEQVIEFFEECVTGPLDKDDESNSFEKCMEGDSP